MRKSLAEHFDRCVHLLVSDALIFLRLCRCSQSLPWERSAQEVHEQISETLEVVSTTLLNSKMRINARIARSSRQILVVLVLNVHKGSGIAISLGQTIIDEINMVSTLPCSHDIVFRLDISMNKMLRM